VDREPDLVAEERDHLGVERLPGRDQPPEPVDRARRPPLREHPVLGRRLAQQADVLALDELPALGRIEPTVDHHRRRPHQPRRDEDVPRRLRPARRRRAPREAARLGAEPVLGLEPLPLEVALRVDDPARLARRPRGEDDRRRVAGGEVLDRGRRLLALVLVEDLPELGDVDVGDAAGELAQVALLADAQRRVRGSDPELEVLAPELRVARHRHRAHPPAREHRQHPLDSATDQRHHRVAAVDAAVDHRAREAGAHREQLGKVPDAPASLSVDCEQGRLREREPLDDVLDEVQRRKIRGIVNGRSRRAFPTCRPSIR
jgi:hypothetical protein